MIPARVDTRVPVEPLDRQVDTWVPVEPDFRNPVDAHTAPDMVDILPVADTGSRQDKAADMVDTPGGMLRVVRSRAADSCSRVDSC